jgi:cation:H+ antiporter
MVALLLVSGLVLLILGAEALVRGAARLAERVRISSLVIGLTVVAFGTSAPELAVSAKAALANQYDIALGNAIGSNIFNILFILGLSALVAPLEISHRLVRLDVPLLILVSLLAFVLVLDGRLGHEDGVLLFLGLVAYTVFAVAIARREGRKDQSVPQTNVPRDRLPWTADALLVIGGFALLVGGARLFVDGAVSVAAALGVSRLVIGLTIVAVGTSLPEVATSVVAARRGHGDMAVGNVVGSCLFNVLGVLGVSGTLSGGLDVPPGTLRFDIPVMIFTSILCLPIFITGHRVSRTEGALLLSYYLAFMFFVVSEALTHGSATTWRNATVYVVIPLTLAALMIAVFRDLSHKNLISTL